MTEEARGQREIVASDVLPMPVPWTRKDFEALGIVFGEHVPDDDLFVYATLPEGWTRRAADHAMYSYLVDAVGEERVTIFYKAAFYDRKADMQLVRQCSCGHSYIGHPYRGWNEVSDTPLSSRCVRCACPDFRETS